MLSPPPPRARAGCSLHLQCQLASSTPVTIRWWYNGLLLHEDQLPEVRVCSHPVPVMISHQIITNIPVSVTVSPSSHV